MIRVLSTQFRRLHYGHSYGNDALCESLTLISWSGKLRAGLDYFKKPYQLDENGDVSIGHFFKYHLGQEMMDKLIEPLLAGIYGGDIYKISLLSTFLILFK